MRPNIRLSLLLLALSALTGCATLQNFAGNTPATPLNLTGNWQISSVNSSAPAANVLLLGDFVSSGTKVTGTFRLSTIAAGGVCGPLNQVVAVSGTIDASQPQAQTVTLTSGPFSGSTLTAQLVFPTVVAGNASGTLQVSGGACAIPSSPLVAIEFPPITGTYSGTVTPVTSLSGNVTSGGAITLNATQSTMPNPDGQFAVTGTLSFTAPGCSSSTPLNGTASGGTLILMSSLNPFTASNVVSLGAIANPMNPVLNPQLQIASLLYLPAPCSASLTSTASYTGTLTRQ